MKYVSTRDINASVKINSADTIKQGIADDGGLFMPCELVKIEYDKLKQMQKLSYAELARDILFLYLTDYSPEMLDKIVRKAYSEANFNKSPAVLSKLDDKRYVLELYHGPTSAFKDMALQIMPLLLSEALNITGETRNALILVATSGDTGKAALEGFKDIDKIDIAVFYPKDGVSCIQKLQMDSQEGNNVTVCSVAGNFDDCQTGVKNIFNDEEIKSALKEKNIFFSSANSINFGRLIPQVVYYFYAYLEMVNRGDIEIGELIDICVPTGNFGNIFAGYAAKEMGLPVDKFICASNKNDVLTEFFDKGIYDSNRKFYTTMSPSMDILISSNLERLLYLLAGAKENSIYMAELKKEGKYIISKNIKDKLDKNFIGLSCDEEHTSDTIKKVFDKYNYLIDPHTAVAFYCAEKYINDNKSGKKMLIVSTASAYKFAGDTYFALTGERVSEDDEIKSLRMLSEYTKTEIPVPLKELVNKEIRFNNSVEKDCMKEFVENFVKSKI